VVTGASKGIGAGIAKALAAEGASIVVNYASSKAGADTVVAAIVAAGGKAVAVGGDVSKAADAQGIIINIGSGVSRLTPAYSTVIPPPRAPWTPLRAFSHGNWDRGRSG
jgi:NAD(P)-dependent dehydrogenase (short-subunit alcohol dehydrogenase family)